MWKSRWLWIILAVCISTSVYFTIRYGLRPKPIPVLNPTQFEELKQIGVVIYKRLHQNIRAERIVLLGSVEEIKNYEQIWSGLAESAKADREKIVFFVREGVKVKPLEGAEVITFGDSATSDLLNEIKQRLKRKQLVIVHSWTNEITHLVKDSLSRKLDSVVRHPVLSISALPFAVQPADADTLQPQCLDATPDASELRRLHCAAYKVARKFLKKRLAVDKIWAVVERHGLKEYLVFIHQP